MMARSDQESRQAWAAHVRRMAERMLQDLVPEDPNLIWARRMSGIRDRRELARTELIAGFAAEQATRRAQAS